MPVLEVNVQVVSGQYCFSPKSSMGVGTTGLGTVGFGNPGVVEMHCLLLKVSRGCGS